MVREDLINYHCYYKARYHGEKVSLRFPNPFKTLQVLGTILLWQKKKPLLEKTILNDDLVCRYVKKGLYNKNINLNEPPFIAKIKHTTNLSQRSITTHYVIRYVKKLFFFFR